MMLWQLLQTNTPFDGIQETVEGADWGGVVVVEGWAEKSRVLLVVIGCMILQLVTCKIKVNDVEIQMWESVSNVWLRGFEFPFLP